MATKPDGSVKQTADSTSEVQTLDVSSETASEKKDSVEGGFVIDNYMIKII